MKKSKAKKVEVSVVPSLPNYAEVTVSEARKLSLAGLPIHWRPDSKVNHRDPDSDLAYVLSETK